jgi:hypothetical protein
VTGAAALVRVDMSPMKPNSDMRRESVRLSLTCRCATDAQRAIAGKPITEFVTTLAPIVHINDQQRNVARRPILKKRA